MFVATGWGEKRQKRFFGTRNGKWKRHPMAPRARAMANFVRHRETVRTKKNSTKTTTQQNNKTRKEGNTQHSINITKKKKGGNSLHCGDISTYFCDVILLS